MAVANAGRQTQARRAKSVATAQNRLAHLHILTTAANPLAGFGWALDRDHRQAIGLGLAGDAVFLPAHRIGARRDRRAGKDAGHGHRREGLAVASGWYALADAEHRGRIAAVCNAHRVTIHRTVVMGRHIQAGHHIFGQHTSICVKGRNRLRRPTDGCVRQQFSKCGVQRFEWRAAHLRSGCGDSR